MSRTRSRIHEERGASLVEYALLVALIAVVCIVAVTFVGTSGSAKLNEAGDGLSGEEAEAGCTEYPNGTGGEVYHRTTISPGVQGPYTPGPCP